MNRISPRFVLGLLLGFFTACSSFDQQWKQAAQGAGGATRWDGQWTSARHRKGDGSPEGNRLRCVLVPEGQKLAAHFHANWLIFAGNFDLMLEPVPGGKKGARLYRGTHDLPAAVGGTYHYDASLTGDQFIAHYSS